MRRVARSLAIALSISACSGGAAESTPAATTSATADEPTTAPAPPPSTAQAPIRITLPACGYGGSATAVATFVDIETDVALHGVTFSFAVADPATHAVTGRSQDPNIAVISPVERGLLDFSTQGTTPFDGELAAGARTRVQHFAGVDALPPGMGGPIEVQLTMRTSDGRELTSTCTTEEMWPSS